MAITVEFQEKPKRLYRVNGQVVPSVTTILGATHNKPALPHAAARETIRGLCKFAQRNDVSLTDAEALYRQLQGAKLTFQDVWKKAAARGTDIHRAMEAWAEKQEIPQVRDYPSHIHGYIRATAQWLVNHQPRYHATEVTVGCYRYGYAGTLDAELELTQRCSDKKCACQQIEPGTFGRADYKTSKRIFPIPMFPQLDAYEIAARDMEREHATWSAIVRFDRSGEYEMVLNTAPHGVFVPFVDAYKAQRRILANAKLSSADTRTPTKRKTS